MKHQSDVTCHRGHTSDRRLWDCPVCVQIEREKAKAMHKAIDATLKMRCELHIDETGEILDVIPKQMLDMLQAAKKQYEEETPCK